MESRKREHLWKSARKARVETAARRRGSSVGDRYSYNQREEEEEGGSYRYS
jgi:hypothetical protein